MRDLKAREDFPPRVLESLAALADFLVAEARSIEARPGAQGTANQTEAARKESKDAVPIEKVKDAPALARELRWRVRNARGIGSGDEGSKRGRSTPKEAHGNSNGVKRKREGTDVGEPGESDNGRQVFRNWRRKGWEREEFLPKKSTTCVEHRRRPAAETSETDLGKWLQDPTEADDEMEPDERQPDDEAVVKVTTEVVIKVRRLRSDDPKEEGLERQRVERKVEVFKWPEKSHNIVEVAENDQMPLAVDQETALTAEKELAEGNIGGPTESVTTAQGDSSGESERAKVEPAFMIVDVQA